jgi:hypothetical protein
MSALSSDFRNGIVYDAKCGAPLPVYCTYLVTLYIYIYIHLIWSVMWSIIVMLTRTVALAAWLENFEKNDGCNCMVSRLFITLAYRMCCL